MSCPEMKELPQVDNTEIAPTWEAVLSLRGQFGEVERHDEWVFRGQQCASWLVESSHERTLMAGDATDNPWKYEAAILREFTRRAYHFLPDPPEPRDLLEWLALMRHHGAPSRLVDCTYSFHVALYFALAEAKCGDGPAAVWAFRLPWLKERFERAWGYAGGEPDFRFKRGDDFRRHFLDRSDSRSFVAAVNPFRLNQRITAQQGVFLCPGNIDQPFMTNLFEGSETDRAKPPVVRCLIDPKVKRAAMAQLRRMNISEATLFPDLDGFARSLRDWFALPLSFTDHDLDMALRGVLPIDDEPPGRGVA